MLVVQRQQVHFYLINLLCKKGQSKQNAVTKYIHGLFWKDVKRRKGKEEKHENKRKNIIKDHIH